ncbi:MAG: hypothetical protein KIT58_18500 [Planctomycetota bacterium]|nr:hypothetical protein [Planctomycetota bacterium]
MAQGLGVLSHVPGGLGVFEGAVLALLTPYVPAHTVLGALLAYRVIYHVIPFLLAVALLAAFELRPRARSAPSP